MFWIYVQMYVDIDCGHVQMITTGSDSSRRSSHIIRFQIVAQVASMLYIYRLWCTSKNSDILLLI